MEKKRKKKRKIKLKTLWRIARKHLFNPSETPRVRALSVGIAAFLAFSPFVGVQTILGLLLAFLFRLNKILIVVLINIITPYPIMPLIIFISFKIGGVFWPNPLQIELGNTFSWQFIKENFAQYFTGGLLLACSMGPLLGLLSYPLFAYLKQRKAKKPKH